MPNVDVRPSGPQPRDYAMKGAYKALFFGLAAMMIWIGLLALGHEDKRSVAICFCFPFALWCVAIVLAFRIRLYPHAIERRGLLGTRRLRREDILGRRTEETESHHVRMRILALVPKEPGRRSLRLNMHASDRFLDEWIGSLPDLDLEDQKRLEASMLQSMVGYATLEGKKDAVLSARKESTALSIITAVVLAWGFFFPLPYRTCMLLTISLPWLVLILASMRPGVFVVSPKQGAYPMPYVGVPLALPGFVLAFRWLIADVRVLDMRLALFIAAAVFLALIAASRELLLIPSVKDSGLVFPALSLLAYSYCSVTMVNSLLDRSTPQVFETNVAAIEMTNGERPHPRITLTPWGPEKVKTAVELNQGLRNPLPVGGKVHVDQREGALKIRWYTVREYEKDPDVMGLGPALKTMLKSL